MYKFSTTRSWYEKIDLLEGDLEVSAGFIDPWLEGASMPGKKEVQEQPVTSVRRAFSFFLRELRLDRGLTYENLAKQADVDVEQLKLLEEDITYQAPPRTLVQLAEFFKIPTKKFLIISDAIQEQAVELQQDAVQFAAQSASFEVLSVEQKRLLHRFVKHLKENSY